MLNLIKKLWYGKQYKINLCCLKNEYKKINTHIRVNGKFLNIGLKPICLCCYTDLLNDKG